MGGRSESAVEGYPQDGIDRLAQQSARAGEAQFEIKGLRRCADLFAEQTLDLPG
jgi:hypothetical protein